jgi:predicted ATPase/DNA-binding CsgD family transcriptional regulator
MGGMQAPGPALGIIGRDAEIAALGTAFRDGARLVTLTGLGGIGKTTIAEAHASAAIGSSGPGGPTEAVVFVDLAPVREASDVAAAVAGAMDVAGADARDLESSIVGRLRRTRTLLVLDNFEHLLGARDLVERVLSATGDGLAILVTSRVALGLPDELRVPVLPLSLPQSATDLPTSGAGRLMLERARQRGAMRSPEPVDAAALAEICRRLDGIPLALELAAAWTRLLSPRAILRRLDERRLTLAAAGGGRHETIARVVEATLELIGPDDRRAFEDLTLFAAPFDEPGARAVTDAGDVLPLLGRLEASALIQPLADPDGEPRFRILEPVREVGAGRRSDRIDHQDAETRFVAQAAVRAQAAADALRDVHPGRALAWMAAEEPNLVAALDLAGRRMDAEHAVQLAMTLATYGVRAGNARTSLDRLREALARGPVPPAIRSEALCAVVNLCVITREDADVVGMCREAVALARVAGDTRREARALVALGSYGPADEAAAVLTEAIELATRIGYTWARLAAIDNLASIRASRGQWKHALELLEASSSAAIEAGDSDGIGYTLCAMADVTAKLGRPDEAYDLAIRATSANRRTWPQGQMFAWTLATQATCETLTGRVEDALGTLAEACAVVEAAESNAAVAVVLEAAIHVLADRDPVLSARIGGLVGRLAAAEEHRPVPNPITLAALDRARASIGRPGFERATLAGRDRDGWALIAEVREAAGRLLRRDARVRAEFGSLTAREADVLPLLAQGRTDAQIAAELGMSPKTASVHVANIKGKLGSETRVDASMRARELLGPRPLGRP